MNRRPFKVVALLGTASFFTLANGMDVNAQQQVAQAPPEQTAEGQLPEQVLVTGSLIRGTVAVGAPVTTLGQLDFSEAGVVSTNLLLDTLPAFDNHSALNRGSGAFSGFIDAINIHGITVGGGYARTLMLVDGMRIAPQGVGAIQYDPSIIPSIALDRVDVLADGASATYGSDAIAGVVNIILRHGFDGAILQSVVSSDTGGGFTETTSALYGRTWDGGDVTASIQQGTQQPLNATARNYETENFTPWGLNNDTPVASASPGIVSTGPPSTKNGTNCTNCYSIPKGQNGVGLTWTDLLANPGTGNEINPDQYLELLSSDQHIYTTLVFDQEIVPSVQFNASAFYSNRRDQAAGAANSLTVAIPTANPYYPAGAPAGLQMNYSFTEVPEVEDDAEISERYTAGFTIDLPATWQAKLFGSLSEEINDRLNQLNIADVYANNVSAALGWTVAATQATPGSPGVPSFTKPSSVPYLNLFCDPASFDCNPRATLNYIKAYSAEQSSYVLHQFGINFDGPVLTLPGGVLRAAIGGDYESHNYFVNNLTYPVTTQIEVSQEDSESRTIEAGFAQLNVPIFGQGFSFPFVQKLELEISDRYDDYSDFGGTNNPRYSADWTVTDGLVLRGSYGTSFVAPSFKSLSGVLGRVISGINALGVQSLPACLVAGGAPNAGSAAALLNPTCSAANQYPTGISIGTGGAGGLAGVTRPADYHLLPETSKDWSLGFDIAPTTGIAGFLQGLDINVSWFNVDITNALQLMGTGVGLGLNDPNTAFSYIVRGDPRFNASLAFAYDSPLSSNIQNIPQSSVKFIQDGGFWNVGSRVVNGVDFNVSYVWDLGAFGAWNAGVAGTYYDHDYTTLAPGEQPTNEFDAPGPCATGQCREAMEYRMRYRARLGWADDSGFSITGFMDYQSHLFDPNTMPPAAYLAEYPNYSDFLPAQYLFDLSLGYNTGDRPTNDYLKQIAVFFTVNNIMNRNPPFAYGGTAGATAYYTSGTSSIMPPEYGIYGRVWSFGITKQW